MNFTFTFANGKSETFWNVTSFEKDGKKLEKLFDSVKGLQLGNFVIVYENGKRKNIDGSQITSVNIF